MYAYETSVSPVFDEAIVYLGWVGSLQKICNADKHSHLL